MPVYTGFIYSPEHSATIAGSVPGSETVQRSGGEIVIGVVFVIAVYTDTDDNKRSIMFMRSVLTNLHLPFEQCTSSLRSGV
jgi:hypothetical protein